MPQYPQVMTSERAAKYWRIDVVEHGPTAPPVNVDVPYLSLATGTGAPGSTVHCTMGNWDYEPTSYTYNMLRNGVPIGGTPGSTNPYTTVVADQGTELTCLVAATNASGIGHAPASNAVLIPAAGR